MDTDYLTPMAYDSLSLADEATHFLKPELGAMCRQCTSEDEYLHEMLNEVKEIECDPEDYLDHWNLLDETDCVVFQGKIKSLRIHIEKTLNTPIENRGKPEFVL